MRILKVKGEGKTTFSPNLVVINFTITVKDYNYDQAINELNYKTDILKQDIKKANFSRDDLKTVNFYIDTDYKRQNNENLFLGYKAVHELKLQFSFEKNILNNLLRIISNSKSEASFRISFELEDKFSLKNEALANAVNNTKNNALIIANSAGIKLGKILNIYYSEQMEPFYETLQVETFSLKSSNIDIVPEDLEINEEVVIEFEIEDLL